MENIFVEFLPPWVATSCQPAFYDKESGTVLQQTSRMYNRVNMLIRMFNKLSKQTKDEIERFENEVDERVTKFENDVNQRVTEFENSVNDTVNNFIEQFNQLRDFVDDYFDNLDVQQEINNKLDEMYQNGELADIVNVYLEPFVAEFKDFEKLENWSNITVNKLRDTSDTTTYYITEVPKVNPYGGDNIIRMGIANDDQSITTVERPTDFAKRHQSPLVTNAGIFWSNNPTPSAYGVVIKDGVILKDEPMTLTEYLELLAIKEDGTMKSYPKDTPLQTIIDDGYKDCFVIFYTIIRDGVGVDISTFEYTGVNPRNIVGVKEDGSYIFLTCDGRTKTDLGLTLQEAIDILLTYNVKFAYSLDGGGSVSTVVKQTKINRDIDGDGTVERKVATMLYLTSTNSETYSMIGEINNSRSKEASEKKITDGQLPFTTDYFSGNLFNKNASGFLVNKYIVNGVITDYNNTGDVSNDILLSGLIRIPCKTKMYVVNPGTATNDFAMLWYYDKDGEYIWSENYHDNPVFTTPANAVYCRVAVRRRNMTKYALYVGETFNDYYEPYKNLQPVVLLDEPNGVTTATLGYVGQYDKLKIYTIDDSSQQITIEVLTNTPGTTIYTNCTKNASTDTSSSIYTRRLMIVKLTGALTIDRTFATLFNPANSTMSISNEPNGFKIIRVEGY